MREIWKDIKDYEGFYKINKFGNIKSLKRRGAWKERLLKSSKGKDGYIRVVLCKSSNPKTFLLHRLIAQTFIDNILNKPQVNHINGNKSDNHINNLEWVTNSENGLHSYSKLGRVKTMKGKFGKLHPNSKKVNQYDLRGNFIKTWDSMADIQREIGIAQTKISLVCKGARNTTGGFIFKLT